MGGPVVVQYARLYPQHTEALVLVDGVVAKAQNAGVYISISKRFVGAEGMQTREDFIRAMFSVTPPEVEARVLKVTSAAPESTGVGAMAAMGDPAVWKDDPIPVPALGIYADKSKLADRETMLKIFPSIDYVEIPQTDHFLMMEKPEEFNRILIAFVDKLK
jgi:pimeloyl-ACP methyl ester carboxylesterase